MGASGVTLARHPNSNGGRLIWGLAGRRQKFPLHWVELVRLGAALTLTPLLNAPPLIQAHAFVAMTAIVLGAVQLVAPKGAIPHRTLGWTWIGLIATMLVTAFFNHGVSLWDPFGPGVCCRGPNPCGGAETCASIHLLSVYFLLVLPFGALHARQREITSHRTAMLWLFVGVLGVGALLTAVPHRTMYSVVFGPEPPKAIGETSIVSIQFGKDVKRDNVP